MSDDKRRVWSPDEVYQQIENVAEAINDRVIPEAIRGFTWGLLTGTPTRRKRKERKPE